MPAHRPVEMSDDTLITAPSPKRLEGKVAIVTGGAKGIDQATVELFVKHGAVVVIADVDDVYGNSLAASLSPSVTYYVHCDVRLEKDIQNLIDSTVSRHGKLDIMINNAGIVGDKLKYKSIVNFDTDEFENILRVNITGSALGMKHAARVMIPRSTGCIISTGSVAGVLGGCGQHAYTASKHALVGLTKNAACELGKHGIRVNCISPSAAVTPMMLNAWRGSINVEEAAGSQTAAAGGPIHDEKVEKIEEFFRSVAILKGITLKTTDIADAALYLASDESRYVSGHNLVVDGGFFTSKNVIDL